MGHYQILISDGVKGNGAGSCDENIKIHKHPVAFSWFLSPFDLAID
jgi:hypothetical protein